MENLPRIPFLIPSIPDQVRPKPALLLPASPNPVLHRSIGGANQISRGEETGEGLAASHWTCFFFLPSFMFFLSYALPLALSHTRTHTCIRRRKRVAPGDRGLGESRMLAVKRPDPSFWQRAASHPLMHWKEQLNNAGQSILGDPWTPARAFSGREDGLDMDAHIRRRKLRCLYMWQYNCSTNNAIIAT